MKAEASINPSGKKNLNDPKNDPPKIGKPEKTYAKTYVAQFFGNNPKEIDLRKLFEKGFKYRGANTAGMPALIVSDADDSNSESDSDLHDPPPALLSHKAYLEQPTKIYRHKPVNRPVKIVVPMSTLKPVTSGNSEPAEVKVPAENAVLKTFQNTITEASNCYINKIPKRSKDLFGEAIETIATNYDGLCFGQPRESSEDVVVIKFIYARACTALDTYKDIILANDILNEIRDIHVKVRFPAVFLGFAHMFKKLHRFEEAVKYLVQGSDWFEKGLSCVTQNYPGHPSKPMKETDPEFLRAEFLSMRKELRHPPRPQAVCRYENCLKLSRHIVPSEKIYITDPDWRPYYQILCRSNCTLEYHDYCWAEKKLEFKDGVKIPSEKDFCGKVCLTPDCEGIIIKILIYETQYGGEPKVIEDKKLNERLEQQESMRKEAERSRREKEALEYRQKNQEQANNKKRNKKKRRERSKSSSEKDNSRDDEPPKIETLIPDNNPHHFIVTEPLENMIVLKKSNDDKENEGDVEVKKKVKKNKEKNTIPLDVFNGPNNAPDELDSHGERIIKLQSFKRSVEVGLYDHYDELKGAGAVPYGADNSRAKVVPTNQVTRDTTEEKIKSFVEEKLRNHGPLKESDKNLTNFDEAASKLIMEKKGLINVLKADERFGSYGNFICLKGDAEKAKKLMEAEEKTKVEVPTGSKQSSFGNVVKALKEKHGKGESFGLAQAAANPSELEKVKRNAEESVKLSMELFSKMPVYKETNSAFAQTDICELDLDEEEDLLSLQYNVKVLTEELQDTKDKLFKIQNEKKLDSREATEKIDTLTAEKMLLNDEVAGLKEHIQRKEAMFKEASKKEKEMKALKENNELISKRINNLEADLKKEKEISYHQQLKLEKHSNQDVIVERLKLKCLQCDFDSKKSSLLTKRSDNEKLIHHLSQLDTRGQQAAAVKAAVDKLNQFTAELYGGLDELQMKYDEKRLAIEQHRSNNLDLDFDLSRFAGPRMESIEIDTLKLLTSISLTSSPPQPPFPPRSPLGPPPGLPSGESGAVGGFRPGLARLHQPPPALHLPAQPAQFSNPPPVGSPARTPAGRLTPVKASSPPAAPAAAPVVGEAESKRIRNTLKLIQQLRAKMPALSVEQADRYIQLLRERNNGKLSGLSVNDIKNGVEEIWKAEVGEENVSQGFGAIGRRPYNPVIGAPRQVSPEDEDIECTICLEKIETSNCRVLKPCNHKFHHQCIGVSNTSKIDSEFCNLCFTPRNGSTHRKAPVTPAPSVGTSLWM